MRKLILLTFAVVGSSFYLTTLEAKCYSTGDFKHSRKKQMEMRPTTRTAFLVQPRVAAFDPSTQLRDEYRSIEKKIETKKARVQKAKLSRTTKTAINTRLRFLTSKLHSAGDFILVPGNEGTCRRIYATIDTELRKIDQQMSI